MTDLLIHSMAEFSSLIMPCLDKAKASSIAEIGSEFGGMSRVLADHCEAKGGTLTCIDPEPADGFCEWAAGLAHVDHRALPSLDALPDCEAVDAWFVDGDHNYYTVFNELAAIDAVQRQAGKPVLAFLHDVSWPCARRDFYYAPERIPAGWRHPHSYDAGERLDSGAAQPQRGLRDLRRQAGGGAHALRRAPGPMVMDAQRHRRLPGLARVLRPHGPKRAPAPARDQWRGAPGQTP